MKYKAFVSVMLCVVVFVSSAMPIYGENEGQVTALNGKGVMELLWNSECMAIMDFEEYNYSAKSRTGFDKVTGSRQFPVADSGFGTSYATVSNGSVVSYKKLDMPMKEGNVYVLSFDINRSENEGTWFIRPTITERDSTSADNLLDTFTITKQGMGYYNNSVGWQVSNPMTYNVGEWYHIMVYMDLTTHAASWYINNEFRGKTGLNTDSIHGFYFVNETQSGTNITMLDNIVIAELNVDMVLNLSKAGYNVPEEYGSAVFGDISSEFEGNIFTSFDDVKLSVKHTNRLDDTINYDVTYRVENRRGEVLWEEKYEGLKLEAGAVYTDVVKPIVNRYDIYTLYCEFVDADGKYSATYIDEEFSIANVPSAGYKNDKFGACIHINKGNTKWEKIKYAATMLGISYLRDEYGWATYEKVKGKYQKNEVMDSFIRDSVDSGIKFLPIFSPWNPVYDVSYDKGFPDSVEDLEALEEACYQFALEYKGVVEAVECGNELNFKRQSEMSCEQYATVMQYMYRGFKRGNPDIKVLTYGTTRSAGDWIAKFADEGGRGNFDAAAIHAYAGNGNSPEAAMWPEEVAITRKALDDIGLNDVELWNTEGNTNTHITYATEQGHGAWLVRSFALCDAFNVVDKYFFYQMQTIDNDPDWTEALFGILRGPNVKNEYGAKPAYLAASNYLAQTENAEFIDNIFYDNVYTYRFKKPDGSYTLMMYVDSDVKPVALNLGATAGTLYDIYGNSCDLKSNDGKYTFVLSSEPVYFNYSGELYENCDDKFNVNRALYEVPENSRVEYEFVAGINDKIEVVAPENIEVELIRDNELVKVVATIKAIPEKFDYTESRQDLGEIKKRDIIDVYVKGETSAYFPFNIGYLENSATVKLNVIPYDNTNVKYWKGIIEVANKNTHEAINGNIVFKTPQVLVDKVNSIRVEDIKAGETKSYKFNIPAELTKDDVNHLYSAVLHLDSGEEILFSLGNTTESYNYKKNNGTNIKYLNRAKITPNIDGVIDADEWKKYKMTDFDKSQVSYGSQGTFINGVLERDTFGEDADYGGKEDFGGSIYAQWDDEYLYLAALVYDDVHYQKEEPTRVHLDDGFYINVCPTVTQRHDTRIDFALSDFFGEEKSLLYRNWTPLYWRIQGALIEQSESGSKVKIIRKENVTIYEARLLWEEVLDHHSVESKNFNLMFGIRDYDGDRDKSFTYGGWYALVNQREN